MSGTASAFVQVQEAIVDGLLASPDLVGVTVWKNAVRPMAREVSKAIVVRMGRSVDANGPLGAQDWETTFDVECITRVPPGSDASESVDALLIDAWAAIRALRLTTQDVSNLDTRPEIDRVFDAADTQLASATFQLVATHRTKANSLQPWSE